MSAAPLNFTVTVHENTRSFRPSLGRNWVYSVGEFIPLVMEHHFDPTHGHYDLIRLDDPSYMKLYNDDLNLLGNRYYAEWEPEFEHWRVGSRAHMDALNTVESMNEAMIPMSDTFEWDMYHDRRAHEVHFYPHIPDHVGE